MRADATTRVVHRHRPLYFEVMPSAPITSQRLIEFRRGVVVCLPLLGAVGAFAGVFGAIAAQSGLTIFEAAVMSATLYAGASQLVAIDLLGQDVPVAVILLSILAVNFRHLLYSAALTPIIRAETRLTKAVVFFLLVDPQFALTEKRAAEGKSFSLSWYLGLGLLLYAIWLVMTVIGAAAGARLQDPGVLGLDMILPIYFLALIMGFRTRPRWGLVVGVSAAFSSLVYLGPSWGLPLPGSPWHVTLGALAGIAVAAVLPPRSGDLDRPARAVSDKGVSRGDRMSMEGKG